MLPSQLAVGISETNVWHAHDVQDIDQPSIFVSHDRSILGGVSVHSHGVVVIARPAQLAELPVLRPAAPRTVGVSTIARTIADASLSLVLTHVCAPVQTPVFFPPSSFW